VWKPCPHCHRKRRLSQKSSTVAEFATVALFCDSRRFRRQIVAEIGDNVDRLLEALTENDVQLILISLYKEIKIKQITFQLSKFSTRNSE